MNSPVQIVYRSLADQQRNGSCQISNESFEKVTVKCTQASSSFSLESRLDPGSVLSFEGKNPVARRVFTKTMNFDETFQVTVKKGKKEFVSAACQRPGKG